MRHFLLLFAFFWMLVPSLGFAKTTSELNTGSFAQIPILHEGRIKPLDSFARAHLLVISGKGEVEGLSAIEWFAELLFDQNAASQRPIFNIPNPDVLHAIGLPWLQKHRYSYQDVTTAITAHKQLIETLLEQDTTLLSLAQDQLLELYFKTIWFKDISQTFTDKPAQLLQIIPPIWEQQQQAWLSPWVVTQQGFGSPQSAQYIGLWQNLKEAYLKKDTQTWQQASEGIVATATEIAALQLANNTLRLEVWYNHLQFFDLALVIYFLTLLTVIASYFRWQKQLQKISYTLLLGGGLLHLTGLVTRFLIMQRPPVTTLYESIIFVSFIAIIFALFLERRRKDGIGTAMGSLLGTILLLIGHKYAAEGDTMGMLEAVLNTNFWLATHVITITIGYGCCLVAGTIAHFYLAARAWAPERAELLENFQKNMLGIGLVALFFSLFGTILGGIWADQSWGRFWGWDPKENGAMLIVLWITWALHGRIAKMLKPLAFACTMAFTNIIVALAWFGVNLLNIGLHSYGFTDKIATNLALFCGAETFFITTTFIIICIRETKLKGCRNES